MAKKEFNNIEFSDDYFVNFINGLKTKNLEEINHIDFDDSIILVCFYNDFENFAKKWMNHYLSIGIKNFVLIDNNSTDNSTILLKNYKDEVNISFWKINEMDNCYRMCGWKQLIFEFYGYNRKYLTVDSDELFIYKDYKEILLEDFIKREKVSIIKTMMLDVYSNKNIYDSTLEDFNYVDKNTYKITTSSSYGKRFIGGPKLRVLGINSSLQKISFINYTGKEVFA
ncbi:MAG: glycosyltransferase family 2 protein [Bacilli bacterium]|nr:glycosyltransferase family 2 protein [Bacilli bacterium]